MLVGQTDVWASTPVLTAEEVQAVVQGTADMFKQLEAANPLTPRPALLTAGIGLVLGQVLRSTVTLKVYREFLDRLSEGVVSGTVTLPQDMLEEMHRVLHPEKASRLILPGG